MTHYLAIDEDGYFVLPEQIRLNDEAAGYELFENMRIEGDPFPKITSQWESKNILLEPFDKPLVAQQIFRTKDDLWELLLPYQWREPIHIESLCLDQWDRFHGLTKRGLPFVFSRKAQAEFFNLLDGFTDDSICVAGKNYDTAPFYLINDDANKLQFWDSSYKETELPKWDLNGPHPALEPALAQLKILKSRVINFGCGKGHDAACLAQKGHIVTATDYSPVAIDQAKELYGEMENLNLEVADAFKKTSKKYDLCLEHTLFCAISPEQREELTIAWSNALDEGGFLLGIFFVMPKRGGPPYGASEWELRTLLEKRFHLLYWKRWRQSPDERQGSELVVYAQKKAY